MATSNNNGTGPKSNPAVTPPPAPPAAEQTKASDPEKESETSGGTPPAPGRAKAALPNFLRVTSRDGRPFRRGGHRFGKEPVVIELKALATEAAYLAITNEKALKVEMFDTDPRVQRKS